MKKSCAILVKDSNGDKKGGKKEGEKGKTEGTLLHLSLPFLRLFSFCTQWTDVPFTLLNSAIENIYIANEQQ